MSALDDAIKYYAADWIWNGTLALKELDGLHNELATLRADLATTQATVKAQCEEIEKAHSVISAVLADYMKPQHLQECDVVIPAMKAWLAAHPAPARDEATT